MADMKALVTGGAGYIGSHLVDRLLRDGHRVTILDDLSVGKLAHIEGHRSNPLFRFLEGSILDKSLVQEALRGCDLVFHLAAMVGIRYIVDDPLWGMMVNVRGTEIVLEEAAEAGCPFILASSSEVYGKNAKIPFSEEGDRTLGPTWVARWSYSTAKALDEHLALAYHAQRGLLVTILRYFNSYGPRLDPRGYGSVVAKFITQALRGEPLTVHGDGQQTRSFTYIDDTVEGTVLAAEKKEARGQVFNIGRREETTILRLAQMVKDIVLSPSEIVFVPHSQVYGREFEDTPRRVPDTAKAERILGFKAKVSLPEGLPRTIDWFRSRA